MRNGRQLITLTGRPDAFGARDNRGHQRIALPFSRAAIRAMPPECFHQAASAPAWQGVRCAAQPALALPLPWVWVGALLWHACQPAPKRRDGFPMSGREPLWPPMAQWPHRPAPGLPRGDRKSVGVGKSLSGRVVHGGRRIIKKKKTE